MTLSPTRLAPWIEVADGLRVTAHGAAWLPNEAALVIADVHLGYARAARRRGGYLPNVESASQAAHRVLALSAALETRQLVIAGDLRHSTSDVDEGEQAEVAEFLSQLAPLGRIDLVSGNHDRGSRDMAASVRVGEFEVVHEPPSRTPTVWTICGHLHPSATVRDETGAGDRFPCALVGPRLLVLPAFTSWAGGTRVARLRERLPGGDWRRIVSTGEGVAEL